MADLVLKWPLWFLAAQPPAPVTGGKRLLGGDLGGRPCAYLFTRADLARDFAAAHRPVDATRYAPAIIPHGPTLLQVLDVAETAGYTHVALDPAGTQAGPCPIPEVRGAVPADPKGNGAAGAP